VHSYKHLFQRSLEAAPGRLHFAAHSHHLWPDVAREAHLAAWDDAARLADRKWDKIFGEVYPETLQRISDLIGSGDPSDLCIAPNVHELLVRLFSSIETEGPVRILSTGSEFHSFTRQAARWVEAGLATWDKVEAEPFDTLAERFRAAVAEGAHDLVYASHVLYDSGYEFGEVFEILNACPTDALVCVDAYHGFMAVPTDLSPYRNRLFYTSGGYKYAMAGEGVCFFHCPKGYAPRPVDTGWYAGFDSLESPGSGVPYSTAGWRMMGATFDPSALYRFNAVQAALDAEGLDVQTLHQRSLGLQGLFLHLLGEHRPQGLGASQLVPGPAVESRGNFLTFRRHDAPELSRRLLAADVITDARGDRLRFGFGLYQDPEDVEALVGRLRSL
jgi:kynureninase